MFVALDRIAGRRGTGLSAVSTWSINERGGGSDT